jgi:hypothetical protein
MGIIDRLANALGLKKKEANVLGMGKCDFCFT